MSPKVRWAVPCHGCGPEYSRGMEQQTIDKMLGIDLDEASLSDADIIEGLRRIRQLTKRWWVNEDRAAATLAINLTTTPFDVRERLLGLLLLLSGTPPAIWDRPYSSSGSDMVAVEPREAFLQLIDRERTYMSNVPVHTPVARLCRALVRRGVLDLLRPLRDGQSVVNALRRANKDEVTVDQVE